MPFNLKTEQSGFFGSAGLAGVVSPSPDAVVESPVVPAAVLELPEPVVLSPEPVVLAPPLVVLRHHQKH